MTERKIRRLRSPRGLRWLRFGRKRGGKDERAPIVVSWRTRRRLVRLATTLVGASLVLVAGWSVASWGGADETCVGCHRAQEVRLAPHEQTSCDACHRPGGLSGALRHTATVSQMLWTGYVLGEEADMSAIQPDPSACLRCHREIMKPGFDEEKTIRVNHRHLLEAGYRCGQCHEQAGHRGLVASRPSSIMERCLTCHDGEAASAECGLCHASRPSDVTSSWRPRQSVPVGLGGTCRGCHSATTERECVACHGGYEMPHPPGWGNAGGHMYDGLVDQPTCELCHVPPANVGPAPHGALPVPHGGGFCNYCHMFPTPHGDRRLWTRSHGAASRGVEVGGQDCAPCHDSVGFVDQCTMCHTESTCSTCHAQRDRRRR